MIGPNDVSPPTEPLIVAEDAPFPPAPTDPVIVPPAVALTGNLTTNSPAPAPPPPIKVGEPAPAPAPPPAPCMVTNTELTLAGTLKVIGPARLNKDRKSTRLNSSHHS